ncbi:MAG TPA: NAD-dependent epimerase/dehydratase family protein [Puia sp.]|nr:NAD-dependent epimerase/dehydratase family protein [Puia sp.]
MITSLITGGAGFIGSHVAAACLQSGHRVIVIDDLSGGDEYNVPDNTVFVKGSINDFRLLEEIFLKNDIDYVYHLAAYAAENLSHFIRRFNYQNNLSGSVNLITLALRYKIKCFVFTSSIAVYGHSQSPLKEEITPCPGDPYGIAKYAVELDLAAAARMFGLNHIIFRPHNVYGENQNIGDKYRNVIGIFMNQIMNNEPITIFGDGEQTRAFTYIRDISFLIANSVDCKKAYNEIFNIGADVPYTVNFIADLVSKEFGVTPSIVYEKARNEVLHAFSDHSKLRKYFPDFKTTRIEQGIKNMSDWAKKAGPKFTKTFADIEIKENLPEVWLK